MGGSKKKKSFIDKKNASTYHLMHRSQRDVGGAVGGDEMDDVPMSDGGMILWPGPSNLPTTDRAVLHSSNAEEVNRMTAWRNQLARAGLLDDNEHERFLKPITGEGVFLPAQPGRAVVPIVIAPPGSRVSEEALVEVHRQLESIPLSADCMDEDIAAALFGDFNEDDYEELNDDFILDAAAEVTPGENDGDCGFDFDAHIQQLLAKAKRERSTFPASSDNPDHTFFVNMRAVHEHDDDEDGEYSDYNDDENVGYTATVATEPGVVAKLGPAEERALCEKFEATLAEYDDDDEDSSNADMLREKEYGALRPLQGDAVVEAALDDFLMEREDEIFIQGTRNGVEASRGVPGGGSGFAVLVGTRMVPVKELDGADQHPEQEPALPLAEYMAQADFTLAQPKERPPTEEICFDGQASYISERERNPWDCESILSTYSNLDNNPIMIDGVSTRRRRRPPKSQSKPTTSASAEPEPSQIIRLSVKTGLPIGVFDRRETNNAVDDDDFDETAISVNRGVARSKDETPEEKRVRKLLVKRERELARMQKKMTREAYADEFQRRAIAGNDDLACKTVFRFP
jgi:protein LTV1